MPLDPLPPTAPPAVYDDARGRGVERLTVHRTVSIVATLGLLMPLVTAWGEIVVVPSTGLAVIILIGATLWMVAALATAPGQPELERLDRWLLVLGLLTLAAYGAAKLNAAGGASTDEAAFVQGAAKLLLSGHDPYGHSLASSLSAYSVPPSFWTYTTAGGHVTTLGYPALPVLLAAPVVALIGSAQAAPLVSLLLLGVAAVVMFKRLPVELRAFALIVCVGLPGLAIFSLSGMTALVMLAALLIVADRWRSVGAGGRLGPSGRISAVALGLALATNQLSWCLAPFLICGIFAARRKQFGSPLAARLAVGYAAIAAGTFVGVNLPFIVWDPGAWLDGVMAPLIQHALPYGQGIVGLTLFAHIGGGAVSYYTDAAALGYLALLGVYLLDFNRLQRACFILPVIPLFFSGRSLSGYWVMLIAVIVVSVATEDRDLAAADDRVRPSGRSPTRRARMVGRTLLFLPAAGCLAVALATPAPLTLTILGARSDTATDTVEQLRVVVHNGSGETVRPHFATNPFGQAGAFWTIARGPQQLPAGATVTYVLRGADVAANPGNGQRFLLQAVTDSPATVSSSQEFTQSGPVREAQ